MTPDFELLTRYADDHDESAFAELVQRHLDHVYSTALRLVGGDVHLAEDVAQAVFTDLARKAGSLRGHATLSGWLHTSARFTAANVVRTEQRRRQREQTALTMPLNTTSSEPDWDQVRGFLDDSIGELSDPERDVLMLRYFEKKPLAEVGAALGVSEDAARMRVDRAIDKLRTRLASRGVTSSAAVLSTVLAQNLVGTAPAALRDRITTHALSDAGASVASSVATFRGFGSICVAIVASLVVSMVAYLEFAPIHAPPGLSVRNKLVLSPDAVDKQPTLNVASQQSRRRGMELTLLDAQTGSPITDESAELQGWERVVENKTDLASRTVPVKEGRCRVPFVPLGSSEFLILVHAYGYADTRLRWNPDGAEPIPSSYTVRLIRPALIHGRVVDSSGEAVAGATVGFNAENAAGMTTEDHGIDYVTVTTDAAGYWEINCLAPETIHHLYGRAFHPDYSPSQTLQASRDPAVTQQLLDGTAVFRLPEAIIVRGVVLDGSGWPVESALVRVGPMGTTESRQVSVEADGSFTVEGCQPGRAVLTVEADGFAPTARTLTVSSDMVPVQVILGLGKTLRLRVLETSGEPVVGASVNLQRYTNSDRPVPRPQIRFGQQTDFEGRIVWENAPDQELDFAVSAPGHVVLRKLLIRPDDEEHTVTLPLALVLSGTVRDSVTRELIPQFRIGIGRPEQKVDGSVQPHWSEQERFWVRFSGGKFHHLIEEALDEAATGSGYIFRFEADGYKPLVTRPYRSDEGEARLDLALRPAQEITAVAYGTDDRPATDVQVGWLPTGGALRVVPGGLAGYIGHALPWLRRADSSGQFRVPDDDTIVRVIVSSPAGYAETNLEELRKAHAVRLGPWSRIDGVWQFGGKPMPNAEIRLVWNAEAPGLSFEPASVSTDVGGHFSFTQIPPGSFQLRTGVPGPRAAEAVKSAEVQIEVQPGETRQVFLGDAAQTQ